MARHTLTLTNTFPRATIQTPLSNSSEMKASPSPVSSSPLPPPCCSQFHHRGQRAVRPPQRSIGVSAMHMRLPNNDRVIIFDRTDFGPSNLTLPDGKCRNDSNDKVLKIDRTAHSVEYDVTNNTFRPLMILTDSWCSSGMVASDGRLIQTGGWNDGDRTVRIFVTRNDGLREWSEVPQGLAAPPWYPTNQILPKGGAIIIGGRRQFNYEWATCDDSLVLSK